MKPMIFEFEINKNNPCKSVQVMLMPFLRGFAVYEAGMSRLCASFQCDT
jgi:hypothetical protein